MLEIRRLTVDDWRRLRAIRLAALRDAPDVFEGTYASASRADERSWIDQLERLATFVAVLDGVDAGMSRGKCDPADPDTAFLYSMWVAPSARGLGVGDLLVRTIVEWARSEGRRRVVLDVLEGNEPAFALYERHGFAKTGRSKTPPPPRTHLREEEMALVLDGSR